MASDPANKESPADSAHHKSSSSSDLFSSAKVLADAAKSAFSHDGAAFDKSEVAAAGEDVLGAASEYGKLRDKGYGSYVDKAEGFLHQYSSSDQKPAHSSSPPRDEKSTVPVKESTPEESQPAGAFGGFGDYVNIAQGFLKK